MGKTSSAVKNRYNSKSYDRIELVVVKGQKDRYKALAARLGLSVNQLFVQAVEQYIADNIDALAEPQNSADLPRKEES